MRLVGLLLALLGGFIGYEVIQGQKPQDHLQQLIDLFGHQHPGGVTVTGPSSPTPGLTTGGGGALVQP